MNDLQLIKEEIYSRELTVPLLESLGCEINTRSYNTENRIEATRPGGDNPRSVQVYLSEELMCKVRTRSYLPTKMDIYGLVSYLKFEKDTEEGFRETLSKSKKYIIDTLNLKQFNASSYKHQEDPNAWLKEIKKRKKKRICFDEVEPNPTLPNSILGEFVLGGHISWINDGIPYNIQKEFDIGVDIQTERISIPIRNKSGEIVGVKGRTLKEEDEDQYKYLPIYPFKKSIELYNLHKALPYIQEKKEIILWEAEKSCLKAWKYGRRHTVSQMGSEITKIQAEIIKRLCPNIKIIVAYDKGISIDEIKRMVNVFGNYEHLYAIFDQHNLLKDKMSPADADQDTFERLIDECCYKIYPNRRKD
ncbi:hypothetical protein [Oceanobacillus kimchii]|uniref:DNA primase n=1 Tax=Oceanobacillus kimchii TaxID=746691 RepID=A0ABQ5TMA8_9BACI|nr:hypothetical protein [Oceanobacillus kimchii]GLO66250.1 DNA primase [Oceanobacillus kimchii]